jgi:hypothetical protein
MTLLKVSYNQLLERPEPEARRVSEFLGGLPNAERMTAAVDPTLYRNRSVP